MLHLLPLAASVPQPDTIFMLQGQENNIKVPSLTTLLNLNCVSPVGLFRPATSTAASESSADSDLAAMLLSAKTGSLLTPRAEGKSPSISGADGSSPDGSEEGSSADCPRAEGNGPSLPEAEGSSPALSRVQSTGALDSSKSVRAVHQPRNKKNGASVSVHIEHENGCSSPTIGAVHRF